MHELIGSLLDNDSIFGRIMTRFGIIIGANLMFVIFSLPVVTIGASLAGLYHVMFKTLRGDGVINPFKQFWYGFKSNWKQATIVEVIAVLAGILFYMEFRITTLMSGSMSVIKYPLMAIAAVLIVLVMYLYPVMTAFADTLPHLVRNSFFFALKNPFKLLVIAFFDLFPLYLTYTDSQMRPLYGFLWVFFGYGAIVMLGASLLLPEFKPYLPKVDAEGNFIEPGDEEAEESELSDLAAESGADEQQKLKQTLEEMKKMGM